MPESFTWLHLTDLHAGMKNQDWLWPDIKEKFFEDLKKLIEKSGPADLVLFTGDMTQKGSAEEFEKVDSILTELWKVLKESGSEPVFLAVPGNHDLLRPADEEDPLLILLTQWNEQPKVREKFWNDQNTSYHQIVNRSFENYRAWWKRLTIKPDNINDGMLPGDFSVTFRKENAKLGIVGLNTAFLQLNSSDYKEKLAIHARQFHKACGGSGPDWIKQHHACLFMTHHPVSWLNREAQKQVNEHIMAYGRFAVHLCGHMHETVYRNTEEAGTEARRLWQGRSLFGLEYFGEKNEKREFGYNIGKTELAETQGKLFFFPRQSLPVGGQREIMRDISVKLIDELHTVPKNFDLHQPQSNPPHIDPPNANQQIETEEIDPNAIEIEFVNRYDEKKYITNIYCPSYIIIDAPMGYGKTRLLESVYNEMQVRDDWFSILIRLSREKGYSIKDLSIEILKKLETDNCTSADLANPETSASEIGYCLDKNLNGKRKVLLLFDEAESLSDDIVRDVLNRLVPSLVRYFEGFTEPVELKMIFSGRYISGWRQPDNQIPLKINQLTPFDFIAVRDTIEKIDVEKKYSSDLKQELTANLMSFTGGHPGCMIRILNRDLKRKKRLIVEDEDEYFTDIIKPVIDGIRLHIPDDLKKIFERISVVRRFTPQLLRILMDKKYIKWAKSEYDLEDRLLHTYLVNKEKGFLKDDITRRLLSLNLRKTDFEIFKTICNESIGFYQFKLEDPKSHRPETLAVEYLFQTLQKIYYIQEGRGVDFSDILQKILNLLVKDGDGISKIESFQDIIREDWEIRFTLNYCLRDKSYNDIPYQRMMKQIDDYIKTMKEKR